MPQGSNGGLSAPFPCRELDCYGSGDNVTWPWRRQSLWTAVRNKASTKESRREFVHTS